MEPLVTPSLSVAAAKYGVIASAAGAFMGLAQTEQLTPGRALLALLCSFLTGVYVGPVLSFSIHTALQHFNVIDGETSQSGVVFSFSVWFSSLVALRAVPAAIRTVERIIRRPWSFWKAD